MKHILLVILLVLIATSCSVSVDSTETKPVSTEPTSVPKTEGRHVHTYDIDTQWNVGVFCLGDDIAMYRYNGHAQYLTNDPLCKEQR